MTSHPRPEGSSASDPPPARSASGSQQASSPAQQSASAGSTTPLPLPGSAPPATGTTTGFHAAAIPQRTPVEAHPRGKRLGLLSLTALGIVYGDIGTSPLYALQQCFTSKEHTIPPTTANVYGVLSLIVWLLVLVVAVKYIVFIMRADNRGEGGILALLALILQQERRSLSRRRIVLVGLGLFGAALLYGDGMITPAISVLGAVEGLSVVTPAFQTMIVPISVVVLFLLFTVQRFGTGRVGTAFGPIMCVWFVTIGGLGLWEIAKEPRILAALNPLHGLWFFAANGRIGFLTLGAVVLAVTGAEALYADMGHFGKRPIRLAWFALVMPALLLNYFGQGAILLRNPAAVANPFYFLAPRSMLVPLVVLATVAAVIASQALISGAFSLTRQAVQLGYSPRVTILHTSRSEAGQIYVPEINNILMIGCLVLVVAFGSTTAIGAAYGIAVTGTMAITSLLFAVVARSRWNWSLYHVLPIMAAFLAIDLSFFAANVIKIWYGGWVPIAIAIGVFTLMSTWKTGRYLLTKTLNAGALPLDLFLGDVARRKPLRVPGTAVFMTSSNDGRAGRVAAPPQAQQGAARAGDPDVRRDARSAGSARGRSRVGREARARLLPGDRGLRIHGIAQRAGDPPARARLRDQGQAQRYDVLSRTRARDRGRRQGARGVEASSRRRSATHNVAVAEKALRHHVAQRAVGDRVLRHPAEPRRRAGSAGRVLAAGISASATNRRGRRGPRVHHDTRLPNVKPRPNPLSAPPTAAFVAIRAPSSALRTLSPISSPLISIRPPGTRVTDGRSTLSPPMIVIPRLRRGRSAARTDFSVTFLY